MILFTLQQLASFDAVVREGGFEAAAQKLGRSHPSVFAAVKSLEAQLGLPLLDRSGYRVAITPEGRAFQIGARSLLREAEALGTHAAQLAMGEEASLSVVIGDLCPIPETLALLRGFFDTAQGTQLDLHFEAISGPWERLLDGEADLIIHHVDEADPRLDCLPLCEVRVIPVVAPDFLRSPISDELSPEIMSSYLQCIIRDSAKHTPPRDYFVIEGARHCTVSDQYMKKEIILQGAAWGHMPLFLVAEELRAGRLHSIESRHFRGGTARLVAARARARPHGPVANRLWRYVEERAASYSAAVELAEGRAERR